MVPIILFKFSYFSSSSWVNVMPRRLNSSWYLLDRASIFSTGVEVVLKMNSSEMIFGDEDFSGLLFLPDAQQEFDF